MTFGRDLEALVRTVEPAHRALDARVEVHHGAQSARGVFLVLRVSFARLAGIDDDARAHRGPSGLVELELLVAARALAGFDWAQLRRVVAVLSGLNGALVLCLFLDERHDVVQAHPVGRDLGERAEHAVIGVVVLEDPEAGERGPSRNGDQRVWALGLVGLCQDLVGAVVARDQKEAVLLHGLPDRLSSVPGPRLHALHERVVDRDRYIDDRRLVLRHRGLELEVVDGHDGKLFRGYAVPFGRVAISRECRAGVPALARSEHDRTADPLSERLLEDAAVHDLDSGGGLLRVAHALLPPIRRRIASPTDLMCSAAARRAASPSWAPSAARMRRCPSRDACARWLV